MYLSVLYPKERIDFASSFKFPLLQKTYSSASVNQHYGVQMILLITHLQVDRIYQYSFN